MPLCNSECFHAAAEEVDLAQADLVETVSIKKDRVALSSEVFQPWPHWRLHENLRGLVAMTFVLILLSYCIFFETFAS
jgi:hypothetical protein